MLLQPRGLKRNIGKMHLIEPAITTMKFRNNKGREKRNAAKNRYLVVVRLQQILN